jgi:hypothetical protein
MSSSPATHGEHMVRLLCDLPFSPRPVNPLPPEDLSTQPPIDVQTTFPLLQLEPIPPPPDPSVVKYRNELHKIIVTKFVTPAKFENICSSLKSILVVADNGLDQAPSNLSVVFIMGRIFQAFRLDFMHIVSYAAGYVFVIFDI